MAGTVHLAIATPKLKFKPACGQRMGKDDVLELALLKVTCELCKKDSRYITGLKIFSARQGNN